MINVIYLEGGGDSKELHARCREGFRKLLECSNFRGRMPRLVASGGRSEAYKDFCTQQGQASQGDYVAMLIDSEGAVEDREATWQHLANRDGWSRPAGAHDDQVLFMTTCMETWIVADQAALGARYGSALQTSALPPLTDLELRPPAEVVADLCHATRDRKHGYTKGKASFELLATLDPGTLQRYLPSFVRALYILKEKLGTPHA